jgi:hypothetical protein
MFDSIIKNKFHIKCKKCESNIEHLSKDHIQQIENAWFKLKELKIYNKIDN